MRSRERKREIFCAEIRKSYADGLLNEFQIYQCESMPGWVWGADEAERLLHAEQLKQFGESTMV